MRPFSLVVAIDQERGIGKNGQLPWHLPADLQHFKKITQTTSSPDKINAVIMGRKTWDSIPEKFRPLPGRLNVVLTRDPKASFPDSVLKASDLEQVFALLESPAYRPRVESVFVIGGAQIFEQTLRLPTCQKLYLTHLHQSFDCDAFFPDFGKDFQRSVATTPQYEGNLAFHFAEYERQRGK